MMRPLPHPELVGKPSRFRIEQEEALVFWGSIVAELAEDKSAVPYNFETSPAVASQLKNRPGE
jgi:hypothetical protein